MNHNLWVIRIVATLGKVDDEENIIKATEDEKSAFDDETNNEKDAETDLHGAFGNEEKCDVIDEQSSEKLEEKVDEKVDEKVEEKVEEKIEEKIEEKVEEKDAIENEAFTEDAGDASTNEPESNTL